ncbi:hypothetical protein [Chitinophaga niabensis]|uniref:SprB repeat-containing protein n=1 Tax=Chitinophaga niabensis TaxID=536979 RepID=A0A1N6DEL2_9BACT|nr:hypothetical protein [Chitinophaga niabensis]SIN69196.1 hypothetical protein SAMN04488055_0668 [Chitinophaga niabensis]
MTSKLKSLFRGVTCLLFLLLPSLVKAQNNWNISVVTDSSRCAASGKVTVTLTGSNAGNLSDVRYTLTSTGGGYNLPPSESNILENIPAGDYVIRAVGILNSMPDTAIKTVNVPGNYAQFLPNAAELRSSFSSCGSGRIKVDFQGGRKPYKVQLTAYPAGYTGSIVFMSYSNTLTLDNLNAGDYKLRISDTCETTAPIFDVKVNTMPVLTTSLVTLSYRESAGPNCNSLIIPVPAFAGSSPYFKYIEPGTSLMWCTSYNGGPKSAYRSMYNTPDTIVLPAGQTLKDSYNKTITYYVKDACGVEMSLNQVNYPPIVSNTHGVNCNVDFTLSLYHLYLNKTCFPLYTQIRNTTTQAITYDTIYGGMHVTRFFTLPFGSYVINSVTADGYKLQDNVAYTVASPGNEDPYEVTPTNYNGAYGQDGAGAFQIRKKTGNLSVGTNFQILSPGNYLYNYTYTTDFSTAYQNILVDQSVPYKMFYPGEYILRITDPCGTYDKFVTIEEKHVYRYDPVFTTDTTCAGLKVTPSGTVTFNNSTNYPSYFSIVAGPAGFSTQIVPAGTPINLSVPGTYTIGMGTNPTLIIWNGPGIGNGGNLFTVDYNYSPLTVDVNRTLGWICPGGAANSGSISAYVRNGRKGAAGVYTYRLAAAGQGATGPYLATNNTGKFGPATSGGAYHLMVNQNYDVQVTDDCGASAVQTVKILDLANAQLASASQPQYCIGETVRLSVINLPATAVNYLWEGPNNFKSTSPNPLIRNFRPQNAGEYRVAINADICQNTIRDTVIVTAATYSSICYSAVTDTSVNPYAYGLLGNWRPARAYVYYGARKESDPSQGTNIRKDGEYADFMAFWKKQTEGWKPQYDTTRWVWNATSTLFNKKGYELENKDPLNRYNAAIYGYDNTVPVAMVQNSRYREAAFEGFEDYDFKAASCEENCSPDRRFDFSSYLGRIDSTEKHSGRYSIRIPAGDTIHLKVGVTATDTDPGNPLFNKGSNACAPGVEVLKSVKATPAMLLPSFTPLAGKKVLISAWVKETQDCNCASYESNKMLIIANNAGVGTPTHAKPAGAIIEGWQRYEQVVDLPLNTTELAIKLISTGTSTVYFDDIRVHPYNANMKSFVFDAVTLRMMAELDENNYATFFEYDDDGTLTRVKKETERGIKTIKETRSALIKE